MIGAILLTASGLVPKMLRTRILVVVIARPSVASADLERRSGRASCSFYTRRLHLIALILTDWPWKLIVLDCCRKRSPACLDRLPLLPPESLYPKLFERLAVLRLVYR
jgi:hypothetical protein